MTDQKTIYSVTDEEELKRLKDLTKKVLHPNLLDHVTKVRIWDNGAPSITIDTEKLKKFPHSGTMKKQIILYKPLDEEKGFSCIDISKNTIEYSFHFKHPENLFPNKLVNLVFEGDLETLHFMFEKYEAVN